MTNKENLPQENKPNPVEVQVPGLDMNRLIALGERYLSHKENTDVEALKVENQENERQFRLTNKAMDYENRFNTRVLLFLASVVLALFGLAIFLIVKGDKANYGFLLISHISTLLLGLISGIGWYKAKGPTEIKESE